MLGDIDIRVSIRPLNADDSLEELTDLLHRAYRVLADMGLRFLATHQDVATTRSRVAAGHCFVAELAGKVVGTICYFEPNKKSGCDHYKKKGVAHVGQLAVEPTLQRHGIAAKLMAHAEAYARERGMTELALDTAEPAIHLIDWYTRLGFRFVGHQQWEVTNYRSVIMSKVLADNEIKGDE
jgi:GNAT superfamily N-acetyltransferase